LPPRAAGGRSASTLDFAEFARQIAAIVRDMTQHGFALRIETKPAPALPVSCSNQMAATEQQSVLLLYLSAVSMN
jgi:hypothetical protein